MSKKKKNREANQDWDISREQFDQIHKGINCDALVMFGIKRVNDETGGKTVLHVEGIEATELDLLGRKLIRDAEKEMTPLFRELKEAAELLEDLIMRSAAEDRITVLSKEILKATKELMAE